MSETREWHELSPDEQTALLAEIDAMPCEMTHTPPFDFAQCERHDTTFALGDVCKYQKINAAKASK